MNIVEGSMKRPVTVTMVALAAVLFGFVALSRLSLNLLPEISYPTLTVRTEYADSAPAEVEKLITESLEEAVSVVQGLRNLRSESRPGVSEITLEFAWNTNMDYSALDVREKIDLVNLPEDAGSPVLLRYDPSLDPILRIGVYGDQDLVSLRYIADRILKKDLESLEGVASVRVRGGLEEEIHVEVNEGKLAALRVPIATISRFLDSQNVNAAGGRLRDRQAEYLVRTVNEFKSMEDIGKSIVYEDAGRQVRLEDVADITRGFKEREIISHVQAQEAVELALYKEGNANTVQVARDVVNRLEALGYSLPEGIKTKVLFNQSTFIEQSIGEVKANAIIGGLLAVFVLFLFLRDGRSTTIIAVAIPLSIIATFFAMQQFNVSLNIMSLGGLALGVGMLVDNAIVVLEAIGRHRTAGKSVFDATLAGASEVSRAVTASTLTTVAVFIPIIFVEGIAGQIFRDQALTVTASLLVSLLTALTIIPVLSSLNWSSWMKPQAAPASADPVQAVKKDVSPSVSSEKRKPGRVRTFFGKLGIPFKYFYHYCTIAIRWTSRILFMFTIGLIIKIVYLAIKYLCRFFSILCTPAQIVFDKSWHIIAEAYPRFLTHILRHRAATILPILLLTALAAFLVTQLGTELVPPFSQGEFTFELEMPPGTPLSVCENKVKQIEVDLVKDRRISRLFASIGEAPELGGGGTARRENISSLNLSIADPENREQEAAVIEAVRQRLQEDPDIRYTFKRPTYFSFKTPIELHIYGHNLDDLERYSNQLTAEMTRIRGLRDVRNSLENGNPEVQITFRRERMAALDLDLESISRTLRNKIRGEVATRLKERDRQLDILVRTANAEEIQVSDVENMIVSQVDGIPIPLSTVADITNGLGPSQITHIGQQRAAVIRANLSGRDMGSASREIEGLIASYPPPENLSAALGGQNRELATSFRSLAMAVFMAIFMVYLVMASQFESFLHPFVILFTIPLGVVGVVFALYLTTTAVSIVVLIGVVMLTGIVVNNAIVLIDFINQKRRAGLEKFEAIIEAARARLRPIFMTSITTILALLPMALGLGQGAELRAPMAIAVIGGLIVGTVLTLVVIPVVYYTLDRR